MDMSDPKFMATVKSKRPKLILALQYWAGDYDKAMRLARRIAQIEVAPRDDVSFMLVARFDAPAPDSAAVLAVKEKFETVLYRSRRRGTGHPSGCNDLWHDLVGEVWRRCLQMPGWKDAISGVFSFEADTVPMSADWLDRILAEWAVARDQGKLMLGCEMPTPLPHINGNMVWVPDLFGQVRGLEGCPSQHAWDVFHASKWMDKALASKEIVNFYKAVEVPRKRVFDPKGRARYAFVHGVKDDSVWLFSGAKA